MQRIAIDRDRIPWPYVVAYCNWHRGTGSNSDIKANRGSAS